MRILAAALVTLLGGCFFDDTTETPLPLLAGFETVPSDRFLVDLADVDDGHPYKGTRAVSPHTGGHVHFDNTADTWPKGGTAPENYIPVYAVAGGFIERVDAYFPVGNNFRYGVALAFAELDGDDVAFQYSIEPMIDPGDPTFYEPYIHVSVGDEVVKGDVIAHLYVAPGANIASHIHFDIKKTSGAGGFMAPALFTNVLVTEFHSKWSVFADDGGTPMPACMGYLIDAAENPFAAANSDCL